MPEPESEPPARPAPPADSSLVDRVQRWRRDPRVAVVVVGLAVVAALVVWMRSSSGQAAPPASGAVAGAPTTSGLAATTTVANEAGPIVHVVGAVRTSGVVQLATGARVRDAVVAAGGASDDADLQRLNLAAPVTDGQRIAVPRIGEPDPAPVAATGDAGPTDETVPGPLPLNTATAAELEELPGIGPTLAEAIVRERERRGGFETVDDLKQVRGIGDARFADIRDLVTL